MNIIQYTKESVCLADETKAAPPPVKEHNRRFFLISNPNCFLRTLFWKWKNRVDQKLISFSSGKVSFLSECPKIDLGGGKDQKGRISSLLTGTNLNSQNYEYKIKAN